MPLYIYHVKVILSVAFTLLQGMSSRNMWSEASAFRRERMRPLIYCAMIPVFFRPTGGLHDSMEIVEISMVIALNIDLNATYIRMYFLAYLIVYVCLFLLCDE